MKVSPYLNFQGQCAEAFRFYERVLGGKITFMQTYGDSPMRDQTPPGSHDAVMHATLQLDGLVLMGAGAPPPHLERPQGISLAIGIGSAADAERIFNALSGGGQVRMPLEKTFWAEGSGMCVDRFGIPWLVDCEPGS